MGEDNRVRTSRRLQPVEPNGGLHATKRRRGTSHSRKAQERAWRYSDKASKERSSSEIDNEIERAGTFSRQESGNEISSPLRILKRSLSTPHLFERHQARSVQAHCSCRLNASCCRTHDENMNLKALICIENDESQMGIEHFALS